MLLRLWLAVGVTAVAAVAATGAFAVSGATIRTIAGSGKPGYPGGFSGDGGPATSAKLNLPTGVAVDARGNVYIRDTGNNRVRKVSPNGKITTIAGTGKAGFSGDGGPATSAQLTRSSLSIVGVAVDGHGNVYIPDGNNQRVRMVSPSGTIRTIAGTGVNGSSGDGGPATSAQLSYPNAVAVDGSGNIFISDEGASTVRKVSPGGTITTIAGVVYPSTAVCGDGGPAPSSSIGDPSGLAVDKQGNLYIATDYAVCKVTPSGTITRIAGTGKAGYFSGDGGPATSATFTARGVAVDVRGSVYITDYSTTPKIPPSSYPSFHVRKVSPSGIISTIAGSGKALAVGGKYKQVNGDGGPATSALLFSPHGIAVDAHGNVYITDSQRVRKIGA